MQDADMIRMANQIAGYFASYPAKEAQTEVAAHISNFWEPRMRAALFAYADGGGVGLDPLLLSAMPLVRRPYQAASVHEPKDAKTGLPKESKEA